MKRTLIAWGIVLGLASLLVGGYFMVTKVNWGGMFDSEQPQPPVIDQVRLGIQKLKNIAPPRMTSQVPKLNAIMRQGIVSGPALVQAFVDAKLTPDEWRQVFQELTTEELEAGKACIVSKLTLHPAFHTIWEADVAKACFSALANEEFGEGGAEEGRGQRFNAVLGVCARVSSDLARRVREGNPKTRPNNPFTSKDALSEIASLDGERNRNRETRLGDYGAKYSKAPLVARLYAEIIEPVDFMPDFSKFVKVDVPGGDVIYAWGEGHIGQDHHKYVFRANTEGLRVYTTVLALGRSGRAEELNQVTRGFLEEMFGRLDPKVAAEVQAGRAAELYRQYNAATPAQINRQYAQYDAALRQTAADTRRDWPIAADLLTPILPRAQR